jgi:hypothetical protein
MQNTSSGKIVAQDKLCVTPASRHGVAGLSGGDFTPILNIKERKIWFQPHS